MASVETIDRSVAAYGYVGRRHPLLYHRVDIKGNIIPETDGHMLCHAHYNHR